MKNTRKTRPQRFAWRASSVVVVLGATLSLHCGDTIPNAPDAADQVGDAAPAADAPQSIDAQPSTDAAPLLDAPPGATGWDQDTWDTDTWGP